jgi:hypothetical protein
MDWLPFALFFTLLQPLRSAFQARPASLCGHASSLAPRLFGASDAGGRATRLVRCFCAAFRARRTASLVPTTQGNGAARFRMADERFFFDQRLLSPCFAKQTFIGEAVQATKNGRLFGSFFSKKSLSAIKRILSQ